MSGAKETLRAQTANNGNLANANTMGFKADLSAFQSQAVAGAGYASRVYGTDTSTGWDDSAGAQISTGQALDVAVQGAGWLAVQAANGDEAYTRAGDLHVNPSGMLVTAAGYPVLSDSGPITVPPYSSINIGGDGTVSIVPYGQQPNSVAAISRIKLVNPPSASLSRGDDGLFRTTTGTPSTSDASVTLTSGVLESSNVNVASAMVKMIELSRQFDLQVKTMHTAEDNASASAKLLAAS
jgi:flagellar basal-body rod protein FlgF